MAKVKFNEIARECRSTFRGDKTGVAIVGLEHIVPNEMLVKDYEVDTENTFTKSFKKGQILFGRRRAYQQKAGVATFDGICSGDITVIEAIPGKVDKDLLPFIIQNERFFEHAVQGSAGSLSPRVKWEHLASYEFDLPSLPEQKILADKLWAAYRLKESYKKLLAATDEMVKSQFIEMFGAEDILNARWPLFRMDEVFSISSSRRVLKSEWKDKGSIPFIRVRDMVQLANKEPLTNEFFVSDEFYNSRPDNEKVKPGDIIVSATSTVGKTYIIKPGDRFYFKDADVLLFRKIKEINEVFFTYGLTMPTLWTQIKEGLGGTTVAHFLISNACKLMQPLPPLELQEQFSNILQQADKSKSELCKSIKAIDAIIKSLVNN